MGTPVDDSQRSKYVEVLFQPTLKCTVIMLSELKYD